MRALLGHETRMETESFPKERGALLDYSEEEQNLDEAKILDAQNSSKQETPTGTQANIQKIIYSFSFHARTKPPIQNLYTQQLGSGLLNRHAREVRYTYD